MQPLRSTILARGSEFYEVSDEYDASVSGFAGDYEYFGYMNVLGHWIIQSHQITTGQYRYVNGTTDYSTAWTNKGSLSYGYFNAMVGTTP
jgi:hypothetical protein